MDRRTELEAAIDANPLDRQTYAVLGDHLQEIGDARGELIALQLARSLPVLGPFLQRHPELAPAIAESRVSWDHGYIVSATVPADTITVLEHPSFRFLVHLTLEESPELASAIDWLAAHPRPTLRTLDLVPADADPLGRQRRPTSTARVELDQVWAAVPELTTLGISTRATFSALDLPRLRSLDLAPTIDATDMVGAIAAARREALASLVLQIEPYGSTSSLPRRIRALLSSTRMPQLRDLAIRKGPGFRDAIADEAVLDGPVLGRVRRLDISGAGLTDLDANRIARHALHFEWIDASGNRLTTDGIRALGRIADTVNADDQYSMDELDDGLFDY